ncbi:MAG TPA: hypothetical protein VGC93_16365 [Thermoanaerobaculia bacterium]
MKYALARLRSPRPAAPLFAVLALLLVPPLAAADTAASRAYGERVELTAAGLATVGSGPFPEVAGSAPPAYDAADQAAGETVRSSPLATLASFGQLVVGAGSTVPGAAAATADAEVSDVVLFSLGAVSLTADKVTAAADVAGACGTALSRSGESVLAGARLTFPGGSVALSAQAAPNTVAFDDLGVRVVLNEQAIGGDGLTAGSVAVNAIHVTLDDILLGGVLYSGEVIVSHAEADLQCDTAGTGGGGDDGGGDDGGGDGDDGGGDDGEGDGDGGSSGSCRSCALDVAPAATLLVPYFAVDLASAQGRTTLFSVTNATPVPRLASVTLWTDWAVPTMTFNLALGAFGVETLNVRDLLQHGPPPLGGGAAAFPGCAAQQAQAADADLLQRGHSGRSVLGGKCLASWRDDPALATGYITVDVVNRCSALDPADFGYFERGGQGVASNANALLGDVFWVTPEENFAQGEPAVHLRADAAAFGQGDYTFYARYVGGDGRDARQPLGQRWGARFLTGGGFDGGTTLVVWRDTKSAAAAPVACGAQPAWGNLASPGMVMWDEEENATAFGASAERFPLAVQEVAVGSPELAAASAFGWMAVDLGHAAEPLFGGAAQGWVVVLHQAEGRYSAGHRAFRLDTACPGGD